MVTDHRACQWHRHSAERGQRRDVKASDPRRKPGSAGLLSTGLGCDWRSVGCCGVGAVGRFPRVGKYNGPALYLQVLYLQNGLGQLWVEATCIKICTERVQNSSLLVSKQKRQHLFA